jgi:stearoyl-CoA desaturase (delta-9 desaturase)
MVIVIFFISHWFLSVFAQTFFLHRYCAHRMFSMSLPVERFFHLLTYLAQGASYLNPRGYALLHRLHHAHSDTPKDPHSPTNHDGFVSMMLATKKRYQDIRQRREYIEARFDGGYPEWPLLDKLGEHRLSTISWVLFYTVFYAVFATAWWQWLFLPAQFLMGPIHGVIVNWFGHSWGYRNFKVSDESRNTLIFDFLTVGELFQNNHHRYCTSPNFAARWFEVDPTYLVIRALAAVKVIKLVPTAEQVPYEDESVKELHWGVPLQASKKA